MKQFFVNSWAKLALIFSVVDWPGCGNPGVQDAGAGVHRIFRVIPCVLATHWILCSHPRWLLRCQPCGISKAFFALVWKAIGRRGQADPSATDWPALGKPRQFRQDVGGLLVSTPCRRTRIRSD